jgi:hypothetical protein
MAASGKLRIISSMLVLLMLGSSLQAQTGDWRAVQNLKLGSRIIVKAQRRYLCSIDGATDDQLVCEVQKRRSLGHTTLTIPRAEVSEVRTLPNQAKDAWIGAGIGAGAGAIAAGSGSRTSRGANAFFGALAGAFFGGLVGAFVPLFQLRGKIIYQR